MAELKLNKTEQKAQKNQLSQLTKYLPTLQLKKQQLQVEVNNVAMLIEQLETEKEAMVQEISRWSILLSEKLTVNITDLIQIDNVSKEIENVAGIEVPIFKGISFTPQGYSYFVMPMWVDKAVEKLKGLVEVREKVKITEERKALLEEELRQTNIKVNLFEKRLIPQCKANIKKIGIFLGDQQIASICNAKIAKDKLKRKEELAREAV